MNKSLNHIAIILDGNGRWATNQKKSRSYGHKIGMENISKIAIHANKLQIKNLTIFCFSTENWNRNEKEVNYLMKIPKEIFKSKMLNELNENDIKINWIGRKTRVPDYTKKALNDLEEKTINNKSLNLNIAFDYGSIEEVETALKSTINHVLENKLQIEDIFFDIFEKYLYTYHMGPVDLLIRTGGEKRLSNFLLLQSRYAELYFSEILWPDFDVNNLDIAIEEFKKRNRRYGGIKDNEK